MTGGTLLQHDDANHTRLAANALWAALRHNRWRGGTSTRRQSDHSGTAGKFKSVATATIPRAKAMNDTVRQGYGHAIAATIQPEERVGNPTTYLVLERVAYLYTLQAMPPDTIIDWQLALRLTPPDLAPYGWARDGRPNTSGERTWYLIKNWDPYLTQGVYDTLAHLVAVSTSWRHEDGQPKLIEDHELPVSTREPLASAT